MPVVAKKAVEAGKLPAVGDCYFLVDPLDGTKEFLKKNGEFTVNIALIETVVSSLRCRVSSCARRDLLGWLSGKIRHNARRSLQRQIIEGAGVTGVEQITVRTPPCNRAQRSGQSLAHVGGNRHAFIAGSNVAEQLSVGSS